MRFIIFCICCQIVLLSCNRCDKYINEIYQNDLKENLDDKQKKYLNSFMERCNEPKMNTLAYEAYRLTFWNFLVDTTHLIRIENHNSNYYFIHKKMIKDSDTTKVVVNIIEKQLLASEWKDLKETINKNDYWLLSKENYKPMLDGGVWIIEGRRPDAEYCDKRSYHIIYRQYPEEGKFENLCDKFLEIVENTN